MGLGRRSLLIVDVMVAGRILRLAGPVVIGMLAQTFINVVDTALVGRLPAEVATPAQAALEISLLLLWFFGGFLGAISVGTQALTARRVGEGDDLRAGVVLTNSVALAFTSSFVLTGLVWFITPWLFPIMNTNPEVARVGIPYWYWRLAGMLSMVGMLSIKSFFDGIGHTKVHMIVSIVMNLVNFILAYGLIFGELGMPSLGVQGAGIAAAVSSYFGLVMIIGFLFLRRFRERFRYLRPSQISVATLRDLARLSVPSGVATMVVMTGFGVFYRIVSETDAAAGTGSVNFTATAIIIRVLSILFIMAIGYGTATATLVSQSMGEGRPQRAARYGWESIRLGVYFALVSGTLTIVFAREILELFSHDATVIDTAVPALRLAGAFEPFMVAGLVFTQAHFGAGNSRLVMTLETVLHFGVLVPMSYLLGVVLDLGILGVWSACCLYLAMLSTVLGFFFWRGRWKEIKI